MSKDLCNNAFAYCRVSSKGQQKKGFGLLAQKKAVTDFEKQYKYNILGIYKEIASGKLVDRPVLKSVLAKCKNFNAALLVPKMCRLGRVLWFSAYIIRLGPKLLVADAPFAPKFVLHLLAAQAEEEGDRIATRTQEGVNAAKEKGVKFGTGIKKTHAKLRKAYKRFAKQKSSTIAYYYSKGFTSVQKLKDILNRNRVKTFRGKRWHNSNVYRLLKELKYL